MSVNPRFSGGIPAARPEQIADFIEGAPGKSTVPWLSPTARDDLFVQLNVKEPERLMKAVEWLVSHYAINKREYVQLALEAAVERDLAALGLPPLPAPKSQNRYRGQVKDR